MDPRIIPAAVIAGIPIMLLICLLRLVLANHRDTMRRFDEQHQRDVESITKLLAETRKKK